MKRSLTLAALLTITICVFSQGAWTIKANYANTPSLPAVSSCVSFSIDSVLYAYNGDTLNNFSAFDPVTNTWTQKADFPGLHPAHYWRCNSTGFAIGHYGYIGTGWNNYESAGYVDFWQYNPATNSWTQKADYPDYSVNGAFGFSIGDTGYIAGGADQSYSVNTKKNYAYIPATNTWIRKADIPLNAPTYGFAAVLNGKAYCGIGRKLAEIFATFSTEFYEYNPTADTWTAKASFINSNINNNPGFGSIPRGFALGGYVYIVNPNGLYKLFRYNPASNVWDSSTLGSYPAAKISNYFGASLLGKGYFCGSTSLNSDFWELDPAKYFNITSYSPDTLCQGATVTVNYSSNIPFDSSHTFSLTISHLTGYSPSVFTANTYNCSNFLPGTDSSGTFTFTIAPGSLDLGIGQLLLIDSNPVPNTTGVTARSLTTIDILKAPAAVQLPSSTAICNGHSQTINGQSSVGGYKYYWSTTTGVFDTLASVTVSPGTTTTYYLETLAPNGCFVMDTTTIVINGTINANLPDSVYAVCPGTSLAIGGTAVANATYAWTDNNGFTSTLVSPVVSHTANDIYHLTISDTTTGCSGSASVTVNAKQAPAQTLCLVSVDSATGLNQIVWEKLDKAATDSFRIYREVSTNSYSIITSLYRDSLSSFEDATANPAATSYRYKITSVDTCGNESILSDYHNTIFLEYIGGGQLRWNDYAIENQVTPVATYYVLVDTGGTGSWQLMISVPGTQNAATDVNYSLHQHARYLLQANWSYTCTPSRSGLNQVFSNVAHALPTGIENLTVDMISMYPNPANDQLTVQSLLFNSETVATVCDLTGQQISVGYNLHGDKLTLNTNTLASGMYWIKLNTGTRQIAKKFVKVN